jgi:hypothetical protein
VPDYYAGYWDEAALRGQQSQPTQYDPALASASNPDIVARMNAPQPVAGVTPGYSNGNVFAATGGQAMSDASYNLLSQGGTRPIATTADVSGTGGVGNSLGRAAEFELDHIGNIFEGLVDEPTRLIFGFDPIGTKIGGAVTGRDYDPLVNQMGGATSQQIRDYEAEHGTNSAGGAQGLHNAAAGTAGIIAAGTLARGGFAGGQSPGSAPVVDPGRAGATGQGWAYGGGPQGYDLGQFATNGVGAIGGGNAGVLASQGGIQGGAGAFGGQLGQYVQYADDLTGLLGDGGGGGGSAPMMMPTGGFMGSQTSPQVSQPRRPQLDMTQTRFKGYGRTPLQFRGNTVWL